MAEVGDGGVDVGVGEVKIVGIGIGWGGAGPIVVIDAGGVQRGRVDVSAPQEV